MKLVHLDAIHILPERQRREFKADELHQLTDSIQAHGLFHPIILRIVGENYVLVSGERRLRAIKDIHALGGEFRHDGEVVRQDFVPYSLLSELSELAAEEAELEENIRRVNLTWQEHAAATEKLNSLRNRQAVTAGKPIPVRVAEIAKEVRGSSEGVHQEITRREIIVAKNLSNPEVKAAKTLDDAFKILKKQEEQKKLRDLGESVGRVFTADLHKVHHADSCDWLTRSPAEVYDVILTDPPYGMGADTFGDSGGVAAGAHGYADDSATFNKIMDVFVPQSVRVTKAEAHLYVFCDIDRFFDLRLDFSAAGWWVFRTPLIWYKKAGMRAPWPEHGPQRKYECILYAVKGKRNVIKMGGDILEYAADANLGHAAQKPVALLRDLLARSVRPGDSVLDPFCGSGGTIAAAHELKCRATGVEIDQASYAIAVKRVEALKAQLELGL